MIWNGTASRADNRDNPGSKAINPGSKVRKTNPVRVASSKANSISKKKGGQKPNNEEDNENLDRQRRAS